jgi:uncharacterized iron-regulated protein
MQQAAGPHDEPAYRLYDAEGRAIRYEEMLDRCSRSDVVLFGEIHDHPVVHHLELALTEDLSRIKDKDLVLGAEMLEADDQLVLDEYLAGLIEHEHVMQEAKTWENYGTDYRPLVDLARQRGLRFIATSVPRRYARLVARQGLQALDRLSDDAKRSIAPLPIILDLSAPGYRQALEIGKAHGPRMDAMNFVAAQAVKDATMAYFILKNRRPGGLVLHYNGDYHSKDRGGICWYLERYDPNITVATLSSVSRGSAAFDDADKGRADVVLIVTPRA